MNKRSKLFQASCSTFAIALIVFAIYFLQWAITVGVLWVIFKIFNLTYTLKVATGIWLVLMLVKYVFECNNRK
mgnify:CR=1 FL=1